MTTIITCPACGKRNRVPDAAAGHPRCGACQAPLPWLIEANDTSFADLADRATLPVLVDIWAAWCAPCRIIAPAVERASVEFAGQLKVVKVNADTAPTISARFQVQGIPTLLFLRAGREVDRIVGALPAEQLLAKVREVVAAKR
jgi:thioredoxin 2